MCGVCAEHAVVNIAIGWQQAAEVTRGTCDSRINDGILGVMPQSRAAHIALYSFWRHSELYVPCSRIMENGGIAEILDMYTPYTCSNQCL